MRPDEADDLRAELEAMREARGAYAERGLVLILLVVLAVWLIWST